MLSVTNPQCHVSNFSILPVAFIIWAESTTILAWWQSNDRTLNQLRRWIWASLLLTSEKAVICKKEKKNYVCLKTESRKFIFHSIHHNTPLYIEAIYTRSGRLEPPKSVVISIVTSAPKLNCHFDSDISWYYGIRKTQALVLFCSETECTPKSKWYQSSL